MAQVTLTIAGRNYQVACEDGQETQAQSLGRELDRRALMLSKATGAVSEGLLLTLTGLMIIDEMFEARNSATEAKDTITRLQAEVKQLKADHASAIDTLDAEVEQRFGALQSERDELVSALEQAEGRALAAEQATEEQSARLVEQQTQIDGLKAELAETVGELAVLQGATIAQHEMEKIQSELEGVRAELETSKSEAEAARAELDEAKAAVQAAEARVAEMKTTLETACQRLEQKRDDEVVRERTQEAIAVAIESLAERVESVAESLVTA